MQGFYVNMVYHSYAMTYGGDNSVLNEPGWVQSWVGLLKQVLQSDVCQVWSCPHHTDDISPRPSDVVPLCMLMTI